MKRSCNNLTLHRSKSKLRINRPIFHEKKLLKLTTFLDPATNFKLKHLIAGKWKKISNIQYFLALLLMWHEVFASRMSYSLQDHCLFSRDIIFGCYLGFPCDQFGGQEPGTPEEIEQFVSHYNVTFPIMSKVSAGIFKQSMWARNRVGIGLSYRPVRLHSLAELVSWNRFLKY